MPALSTLDPRGGVAVVTGAASGIGAALTARLLTLPPEHASARDIARRVGRTA